METFSQFKASLMVRLEKEGAGGEGRLSGMGRLQLRDGPGSQV